MGRIIALLLMSVMLCGCPGPSRKVDPYMAAHIAISQASLVLPVAEGIFSQWLYAHSKLDSPDVKRARLGFSRAMTVLYNSIKLAHDGVNIAKQAQEDPDMSKTSTPVGYSMERPSGLLGRAAGRRESWHYYRCRRGNGA
jgi:hypothetical protein